MTKERDYFFDNIKAVLIFLVVLGHFLLPIHGEGNVLVLIKRLIYVFHMPLFVFVSGYFSKRIYKDGKYNFKKILYLIKAYRPSMQSADFEASVRVISFHRAEHRGICLQ